MKQKLYNILRVGKNWSMGKYQISKMTSFDLTHRFLFIVKIDRVSVTDVNIKRCVKSNEVLFEI